MKHNVKLGQKVVASIGTGKNWVRYSEGNNGEEDYYRDVYSDDGRLIYSDGETCTLVGFSELENKVILENENVVDDFSITIEQFKEDFII